MTQPKIGDIVKSYDFVGVDSCYMVGKVVGVFQDGTFRAEFIKRVFQDQEDRKFKTNYFTAPLQGEHFMDRPEFPRVVVVA
jgi:hypothetical protein